jgi:transglutaminase-like putative cysteine protease
MRPSRRSVLRLAAAGGAACVPMPTLSVQTRNDEERRFAPAPGDWRTIEVTTRIEILRTAGATRAWVPVPAVDDVYQTSLEHQWSGNASQARLASEGRYGAAMVAAVFDAGTERPVLEVVSRIRTQSRLHDWAQTRPERVLAREDTRFWTAPTELMPTDGIVGRTARSVIGGRRTDVAKVRALFDWTLAHTYRDVQVRGCGTGDIATMLESGNLGGKCGDINALFVGMARAVGIPARDVYGIRVSPSAFGYKELGAGSPTVTRAQHCRAEVFLRGHGWVAMDPADVGKVMRLETANWIKDPEHPVVAPVKHALFGGWEGNWMAYNMAHDVALPGSSGPRIGFFMYPEAENDKGRFDPLDPDTFRYRITARQIEA